MTQSSGAPPEGPATSFEALYDAHFDAIGAALVTPEFRTRALYDRFGIEGLRKQAGQDLTLLGEDRRLVLRRCRQRLVDRSQPAHGNRP